MTNVPLTSRDDEDPVLDAGGIQRRICVFRMPDENPHTRVNLTRRIPFEVDSDNALYARVTQEDGHLIGSSPIYIGGRRWALTGAEGMGRYGGGDRPGPRIERPGEALGAHPMCVPHESLWVGFDLAGERRSAGGVRVPMFEDGTDDLGGGGHRQHAYWCTAARAVAQVDQES